MDKKRSLLNVITSIVFKAILLVSSLLVRRYLIHFIGNDINGLNSLYLSVIGVLSVAELGIGDAITFCMYKPIVERDTQKISALYNLFRKVYLAIGGIIAFAGCLLMPFLPNLAKGSESLNINLYLTFGLMLLSVVLTYLFSAKTSLMNAYRDNYITTTITSGGQLFQQVLQIAVLFLTQSFVWYLICRIVAVILQWVITEIITKRKYGEILTCSGSAIGTDTQKEVIKNVKAMFMHRVGGVLVNTVSSIVVSALVGVAVLGRYSNYTTIMTAMTGTIALFFSPLTSTIGHLYVQDKHACVKYYNFFYTFNFALGCVFFLGYYGVIDNVITLLFGSGLGLNKAISFAITVNYFVQFMRQSTLLFRDASGTFYNDRWKPLFEGLLNVVLSVVLLTVIQKFVGEELAVLGVLVASIITNLFVCHIVEPYVLFRHAFNKPVRKQLLRNYCNTAIFAVLLVMLDLCKIRTENIWVETLANGGIAVGLSLIPIFATIMLDKNFRHFLSTYLLKVRNNVKRTKNKER